MICWLVEGLCYDEIARRRGTSTRTIANQISAVFRRMRVSGRNDLVQRLFAGDDAMNRLPATRVTHAVVPPTTEPKADALERARRSA